MEKVSEYLHQYFIPSWSFPSHSNGLGLIWPNYYNKSPAKESLGASPLAPDYSLWLAAGFHEDLQQQSVQFELPCYCPTLRRDRSDGQSRPPGQMSAGGAGRPSEPLLRLLEVWGLRRQSVLWPGGEEGVSMSVRSRAQRVSFYLMFVSEKYLTNLLFSLIYFPWDFSETGEPWPQITTSTTWSASGRWCGASPVWTTSAACCQTGASGAPPPPDTLTLSVRAGRTPGHTLHLTPYTYILSWSLIGSCS